MKLTAAVPNRQHYTRSAFTLIELIVAIVIIGILAALIIPAVSGALASVKNATVVVEIKSLETAIDGFRLKFGVQPPSRITISTTANGWNRNPESKSIIRRIWPQFDFSMPSGSFPAWWKAAADSNGDLTLSGSECLVFFLGGVVSVDHTGTNSGPSGFSANPAFPFNPDGTSRIPPFFEFDIGRFTDIDGNGLPEYADTLPGKGKKPYLYFSSYEGSGYRVSANPAQSELPNLPGVVFSDIYRQSSIAGTKPGTATFSLPAHKAQSFQIISPGYDGEYGAGGIYNPDLPDSGLVGLDGRPDKDAFDNITNFSAGTLRK